MLNTTGPRAVILSYPGRGAVIFLVIPLLLIPWILVIILWSRYEKLHREVDRRAAEEASRLAKKMYSEWVEAKLREVEKQLEEVYRAKLDEQRKKLEMEMEKWKREWEKRIRRDAVERSVAVLLGKASEHVAPLLMASQLGIDPRDLRFLGTPVDYVAFKGLSTGSPEEIVFIEVKSSKTGALTPRERAVKRLVEAKRVRWVTLNLYQLVEEAKKAVREELDRALGGEGVAAGTGVDARRELEELLERLGSS